MRLVDPEAHAAPEVWIFKELARQLLGVAAHLLGDEERELGGVIGGRGESVSSRTVNRLVQFLWAPFRKHQSVFLKIRPVRCLYVRIVGLYHIWVMYIVCA